MCVTHGRGAIEICLSEKGALAKKRLGNTVLKRQNQCFGFFMPCTRNPQLPSMCKLTTQVISHYNNEGL